MVALAASFMEQEIERCERYGMRSRWDVARLRYWQDRQRQAAFAERSGMVGVEKASPDLEALAPRETPGRSADVVDELVDLLDAREVPSEPRPVTVGETSGPSEGPAPADREAGGTLPLFGEAA